MSTDTSFVDHKLCGFLYAFLTVTHRDNAVSFAERCEIFGDGGKVRFQIHNGVVLGPVVDSSQCGGDGCKTKRKNKIGMLNGSVSVVHQLHAMVTGKCTKIDVRMVWVEALPRVVVLVDMYVPIQVWSGCQGPSLAPFFTI